MKSVREIDTNAYDKLKANNPNALQGLHLDKTIPIVTVCAGGKSSLTAAEQLNEQGFEAYSLQGGMKGWGLSWNTAILSFPDFEIIQFRRTDKGCLSYLAASNNNLQNKKECCDAPTERGGVCQYYSATYSTNISKLLIYC